MPVALARPQPRAETELERAAALQLSGRLDEAEQIYRAILAATPDRLDALHLLGVLRHQQGRNVEALRLIGRVVSAVPKAPDVLNNYGLVLRALDRHEEAVEQFERALAARPNHAHALVNSAETLKRLHRHDAALAACERLLIHQPANLGALNECGGLYGRFGRPDAALACYDRALAIAPRTVELHINRGTALVALSRFEEALASFADAAAIEPDRAEAHYNASLVRLRLGEFAAGWKGYEWRWRKAAWRDQRRHFSAPLWLGQETIEGRAILLHAEQGFGDTLQFARYIPLVARRGATVIVECPAELARLLEETEGVARVIPRHDWLPSFDLHCPLLSLPLAFGTTVQTIPNKVPYVKAPELAARKWSSRLAAMPRPRVGLAWAGSPAHLNDHNRSIALRTLAPLLAVEGVHFVSLQKEVGAADAALLREHGVTPLGGELSDFSETAAAIAALDLVVSVDTAVAHLAGAMGKTVLLLLPFLPDWRWMLDRSDSPWYPCMRLFRQERSGDWSDPIERLRQVLPIAARREAAKQPRT